MGGARWVLQGGQWLEGGGRWAVGGGWREVGSGVTLCPPLAKKAAILNSRPYLLKIYYEKVVSNLILDKPVSVRLLLCPYVRPLRLAKSSKFQDHLDYSYP